jgi:hypothetical protein
MDSFPSGQSDSYPVIIIIENEIKDGVLNPRIVEKPMES